VDYLIGVVDEEGDEVAHDSLEQDTRQGLGQLLPACNLVCSFPKPLALAGVGAAAGSHPHENSSCGVLSAGLL
jgi:hypothetical protein